MVETTTSRTNTVNIETRSEVLTQELETKVYIRVLLQGRFRGESTIKIDQGGRTVRGRSFRVGPGALVVFICRAPEASTKTFACWAAAEMAAWASRRIVHMAKACVAST